MGVASGTGERGRVVEGQGDEAADRADSSHCDVQQAAGMGEQRRRDADPRVAEEAGGVAVGEVRVRHGRSRCG